MDEDPSVLARRAWIAEIDGHWIQQTDDGSLTLVHYPSGFSFHSQCGAATETRHVYLENSGVAAMLRQGRQVRVLEVGLGTGMAFLQSAAEAVQGSGMLDYVGLENRLLKASVIERLQPASWIPYPGLVDSFLAARRGWPADPPAGRYETWVTPAIRLAVVVGDACQWRPREAAAFDAVYFDPFGPRDTPHLWQTDFLQRMFDALLPGGRLVSYCVSGQVRRQLTEIGFVVYRLPGPAGGKREVLVAQRPSTDGARPACVAGDRE